MFSKTADPTAAPTPSVSRPTGPGANAGRSVLGADLRITGEVSTTGSVEVLGEIDGNIAAHGLIIGQEGKVTGSVTAASVEVKGKLDGKVACESLTLRSTAEVKADVTTKGIVIESGAMIDGRFLKPKG
ncbi:polymer-forming cytoskeletal protein [Tabrizicola sp.]|uniref:bactofilin family protein n=1 Tax=Tabrizicola sp. TaxID=2005166 RepID=UPI00261059D0|nr:polymer-forming cytoskeletal protein [Tabrizicola sp.]MDM7931887.1 polymer-forming cytoskeletal protein [Tabrizicola sp.]